MNIKYNKKKIILWSVGTVLVAGYSLYTMLGFRSGESQEILGGKFDKLSAKYRLVNDIRNLEHDFHNLSSNIVIVFSECERTALLRQGVNPNNIMTAMQFRQTEIDMDNQLRAMRGEKSRADEKIQHILNSDARGLFASTR